MNTQEKGFPNASSLLSQLRETNESIISAPIDVDAIARALGIRVEFDISLENRDVIGEISFVGTTPIIRVNPVQNAYEPRRRFTLAHEIGHYCLHSLKSNETFVDSQKTMSRSQSYWDFRESEANTFAAQLLMPKELILSEGELIIDMYKDAETQKISASEFMERMSHRFVVSNKAMEYRLRNIGILK